MAKEWRQRLLDAVGADGRSDRAISIASGLSENFVNQLRNEEKDLSVTNALRLCQGLNVGLSTIFLGREITAEDEELLRLLGESPERQSFLTILRALVKGLPHGSSRVAAPANDYDYQGG